MSRPARAPGNSPPGRKAPLRQRQHLIDACISALHLYGPSRTTVEKVVTIAAMSPGIVRFYFDSKAAMLVASLQYLATEFEERVLAPVDALKAEPVAALRLMVDLFLDPDIASARKVSVWYAFWGEASSRQEYYDICGHIDERFAALVHELVGALIGEARPQLDTDGIALGLIGVLEILWQDIAFQAERDVDRAAARRRCLAYLRSVFPGCFEVAGRGVPGGANPGTGAGGSRFAGWMYGTPRIFGLECEAVFRGAWLFVGHESQIPREGDFLAGDTGVERALVLRTAAGVPSALRNSCPELPHALLTAGAGHVEGVVECRRHGLVFSPEGRSTRQGGADLIRLELEVVQGLLFVRSPPPVPAPPTLASATRVEWPGIAVPEGLMLLGTPSQAAVVADWKVLVELWLAGMAAGAAPTIAAEGAEWAVAPTAGWSAMRYGGLVSGISDQAWRRRYMWPNHLIETRPDGLSVIQAVPVAAGRCLVRRFDYTRLSPGDEARAAAYLAQRLGAQTRRASAAMAESIQHGLTDLGYEAAAAAPAVAWFRGLVSAALPVSTFERS